MKTTNYKLLAISFFAVIIVAVFGSLFTQTNTSWYQENKPSITPQNYVFPIAWTTLYILIALSIYFAFTKANKKQKSKLILLFASNLILNAVWTPLYFALKNPVLAFIDIILILITTILLIKYIYKINKKSSYLLIPYLLWLGFATILNYLSI